MNRIRVLPTRIDASIAADATATEVRLGGSRRVFPAAIGRTTFSLLRIIVNVEIPRMDGAVGPINHVRNEIAVDHSRHLHVKLVRGATATNIVFSGVHCMTAPAGAARFLYDRLADEIFLAFP